MILLDNKKNGRVVDGLRTSLESASELSMPWKEVGCSSGLNYVEQLFSVLFMKYLDDLEQEKAMEASQTSETRAENTFIKYKHITNHVFARSWIFG